MSDIDRKKAEVRARLEAQAAGKKAKKGFMTPERKKKLRVGSLIYILYIIYYILYIIYSIIYYIIETGGRKFDITITTYEQHDISSCC